MAQLNAVEAAPNRRHGRGSLVSALGMVMILTWGSSYYLMTVLAKPIALDTGWRFEAVTGALSLGLLVAALASPLTGRTIARIGGRPVMAAGVITLACGLLTLAVTPWLFLFWLGWFLIGLGMAATLYDAAFATLGRLYAANARQAITLLTLWGGFASTVCWPLSAFVLDLFGWRAVALLYAALHVAVTLPLVLVFLPKEAEAAVLSSAPGDPAGGDASSHRLPLLAMTGLLVVNGLIVVNVSTWLFSLLQVRGIGLAEAVLLGTLIGPAQVMARVLEMAGRGRHHPIWTALASSSSIAIGLLALMLDLPLPALALMLYGAGNGLFSIARGALPLALFGAGRYPVIMGRLARPALVAQAVAPTLGAWVIHSFGASRLLLVLAVLGVAHLGLTLQLWWETRRMQH